jgi:hypothetical protein
LQQKYWSRSIVIVIVGVVVVLFLNRGTFYKFRYLGKCDKVQIFGNGSNKSKFVSGGN